MSPSPVLELDQVSASYGRFRALFDVSFSVEAGRVTALLGRNGAGKSTVARVATGLVSPSSGRILISGEDVTGEPAWKIVGRGVAHAPEGRPVFATLDVEDNLRLTFFRQLPRKQVQAAIDRAYERFPRLAERRGQLAGTLSGGEQRMLALARVLAVPPKLLVVDELSLGLSPRVVDEVFRALREIRDSGSALLVVEQQVTRALELAEHVCVLRKGRVVFDGPTSEMSSELASELLPVPAS
ncbi:MAG: ABC transporter ATP-binding protein [Actinomycetota bacterium]|nr:ABC transporter ATP-binding protein [Actinomycetota bacterium]